MKVGVVGAGLAGLACAEALVQSGVNVSLFDKGRGPGGRLSSRRIATALGVATFDHGASSLKPSHPSFTAQLEAWSRAGVAAKWSPMGHDFWVGAPAMNAIPKFMARSLDVKVGVCVQGVAHAGGSWKLLHSEGAHGPFDSVVIALPAEQAAAMLGLHDLDMGRAAVSALSQPCWAVMLVLPEPLDLPSVIRDEGIIALAVRDSDKAGRSGPTAWTIQASHEWSRAHLDASPDCVIAELSQALASLTGKDLARPVAAFAHRWRYAHTASAGTGAIWNQTKRLGACGDWLFGSGAEAAWLSGRRLAELMTTITEIGVGAP